MASNMQLAQELLFGAQGLGASNFKMFPGHSRETTAEEIAAEIVRALQESPSDGDVLALE